MSNSFKDENCIRDMCVDVCSKQKNINSFCNCSTEKIAEIMAKRKEYSKEMGVSLESLCEKCTNQKHPEDPNGLCRACYKIQATKEYAPCHEDSNYWRDIKELAPLKMVRRMVASVADMHISFRSEIAAGRYDWFKPIYNSPILEYMVKANRELQEITDNGNLIRGQSTKKMLKEGRIFTY